MNNNLMYDNRKVIKENFEVIKTCINASLDEIYDTIEVLKNKNSNDESIESLNKFAEANEQLRRNFLNDCLSELEIKKIIVIIDHRLQVLENHIKKTKIAKEELAKIRGQLNLKNWLYY